MSFRYGSSDGNSASSSISASSSAVTVPGCDDSACSDECYGDSDWCDDEGNAPLSAGYKNELLVLQLQQRTTEQDAEIRCLRAKVASRDLLLEQLQHGALMSFDVPPKVTVAADPAATIATTAVAASSSTIARRPRCVHVPCSMLRW